MKAHLLALIAATICVALDARAQAIRIESPAAARALMEIAAKKAQERVKPSAGIYLGTSGSVRALQRLCQGRVDIAIANQPILPSETSVCERSGVQFLEFPLALDNLEVVVNRRNAFVSRLTLGELRTAWRGQSQAKIVRWDQVNEGFPALPLKLVGPEGRQERVGVFAEALFGTGEKFRRDYVESSDDLLLVQAVSRDINALSYLSRAIYLEHRDRLRNVRIDVAEQQAGPFVYPLILYVGVTAVERDEVASFIKFLLANGTELARSARLDPLLASTYVLSLERLKLKRTGTVWAGRTALGLTPATLHSTMESK